MSNYADLELGIHRWDAQSYTVELRFSLPGSDTDIRLTQDGLLPAHFDTDRLRELTLDAEEYGRYLGRCLFADATLYAAFAQACKSAAAVDAPLHLRLFIGSSAPELHSLRWETLRDPDNGVVVCTGEQIFFSRYLSSIDWRPVHLRPKGNLRALVVIADPSDVADYQLSTIDVAGELERVTTSLGEIPVTALAARGTVTFDNVLSHIREGYDIVYLVCHGVFAKGEAWLWLEDATGKAARVSGNDLVMQLKQMQQRPSLCVLASCDSAGARGDMPPTDTAALNCATQAGVLATLGPRLAEAGIPAVLAMQGLISQTTVATCMPVFFRELQQDGRIDRALALARWAVRDHVDWWAPVLFMRLKTGRIWYNPGFTDEQFKKWPTLVRSIQQQRCTPILGFGLIEALIGSSREIAHNWADRYTFPMSEYNREDLPQVAQYLAVNQAEQFPRDELFAYVRQEIIRRYGNQLPAHAHDADLPILIEALGALQYAQNSSDPHLVLARLPFPIYITTNPDNLLETALVAAGKKPQVALCPWNEYVEQLPVDYTEDPDQRHPLIYHLFGHIHDPDSLVLTEDDYFDYLIGVTRNNDLIPAVVRQSLANTALLFLGFRIDGWGFRVLFRSLMSREGRSLRRRYAHIAVQIELEEDRNTYPEQARQYLESYFQDADINIYWGSVEDFIRELTAKLQEESSG